MRTNGDQWDQWRSTSQTANSPTTSRVGKMAGYHRGGCHWTENLAWFLYSNIPHKKSCSPHLRTKNTQFQPYKEEGENQQTLLYLPKCKIIPLKQRLSVTLGGEGRNFPKQNPYPWVPKIFGSMRAFQGGSRAWDCLFSRAIFQKKRGEILFVPKLFFGCLVGRCGTGALRWCLLDRRAF